MRRGALGATRAVGGQGRPCYGLTVGRSAELHSLIEEEQWNVRARSHVARALALGVAAGRRHFSVCLEREKRISFPM